MSLFGFVSGYYKPHPVKFTSATSKNFGGIVIIYSFRIWNNSTEKVAGPKVFLAESLVMSCISLI